MNTEKHLFPHVSARRRHVGINVSNDVVCEQLEVANPFLKFVLPTEGFITVFTAIVVDGG